MSRRRREWRRRHPTARMPRARAATDLDAHLGCASGEGEFERLHVDRHAGAGRTRQAKRPLRRVDSVVIKLDAGEMARRAARLLHPMRGVRRVAARAMLRTLERCDLVQHPATIEGFDAGRRKAAHAERQPLQRRMRVGGLLQHQDREPCKPQLAGKHQADGPGTGNHDIMGKVVVVHERLLCRCSTGAVRRVENHTDEQWAPGWRPVFVVGIPCTRQETRAFASERTSFAKGLGLTKPSLPFPTGAI